MHAQEGRGSLTREKKWPPEPWACVPPPPFKLRKGHVAAARAAPRPPTAQTCLIQHLQGLRPRGGGRGPPPRKNCPAAHTHTHTGRSSYCSRHARQRRVHSNSSTPTPPHGDRPACRSAPAPHAPPHAALAVASPPAATSAESSVPTAATAAATSLLPTAIALQVQAGGVGAAALVM